ncbi:hypothetical protein ACIP79_04865 [Streptomyces sp. NPDC088747]|uniref:hypothetical protein n=1 Tax=Streptomyces sp. NPDC088747 TaxID=3365886 RepID=UPI0037FD6AB5
MTSATFPRRRARIAAAATVAGLAAALVLTGCSDSGDDSADESASPTASASASADTGGGSGSTSPSGGGDLEGSWLATTDGKAVALVITGTQAGLFETGGTVCSGTAGEESGMRMIRLKCTDGSEARAVGMVDSVSGAAMKVTWEGDLGPESYTKSEGGQLPTGLPTGSLG